MVSKRSSQHAPSKISSAAAPAVSSQTQSVQKSAIHCSAFSPSEFQLALFASVIQGLDSQHLRVHDISSGRLRCEHALGPKITIHSLDWGSWRKLGQEPSQQQLVKKKRKRSEEVNGSISADTEQDVVIALATSESDIRIFSPSENKIVASLKGGHERGVRDFKFTRQNPTTEGWSIGGDGKLVHWDLRKLRPITSYTLPSPSLSSLARPIPSSSVSLCASHVPYILDMSSDDADPVVSFNAHRNLIHTLIPSCGLSSEDAEMFLSADADRYINVFDIKKKKLLGNLIAEKSIGTMAIHPALEMRGSFKNGANYLEQQVLATVNDDGVVEIFVKPILHFLQSQNSTSFPSLKAQRKNMTKKADASVRLITPDKTGALVPVFDVSFQGPDLILARAEGGVNLVFERVRWQDEETGALTFQGVKEIIRGKSGHGAAIMNGAKDLGKSYVDESHAVVVTGGTGADIAMEDAPDDAISISSGVEEEDSSDSEAVVEEGEVESKEDEEEETAGKEVTMTNNEDADDDSSLEGGPTFGELMKAQEQIDVAAAFSSQEPSAAIATENSTMQIPSGVSLATVLAQSLRTNDNDLLESCFHTTDTDIVRATIQRLDPNLSAVLFQRLAERLSSRPGRYGHLLVWVQWICVAHGGYIAGNRDVLRKVSSLFQVLDQRCSSLDSLLLLKGKLDMLDAQMGLRRQLAEHGRLGAAHSDDEEGVIYVEGEVIEESSEDEEPRSEGKSLGKYASDSNEDEEEDMPLTINGVEADSDDEGNESAEGDIDLVDDEAEETDNDSEEESDEEDDDDEEDEDMDSDEVDANDLEDALSEDDESIEEEKPSAKELKHSPRKPGQTNSFKKR